MLFLVTHIYHDGHYHIYESYYFTTYLSRRAIRELGLTASNRTLRSLCTGPLVDNSSIGGQLHCFLFHEWLREGVQWCVGIARQYFLKSALDVYHLRHNGAGGGGFSIRYQMSDSGPDICAV